MDALSSTSSLLGLPPPFVMGGVTGFIGYGISWFSFKFLLNMFSTPEFKDRFKKLDTRAYLNFLSLGPSTAHAICQVIGTYPIVFTSQHHLAHRTTYFNDSDTYYSGIFVGYLIADILALGIQNLGVIFSIHHISASAAWTMVHSKKVMQWYSNFLQFNELSTIFVNIRQVLLTAGYTSSSKEVTISSLFMFLVFGVVRVLPLPWIVYNWITTDVWGVYDKAGTIPAIACSIFMTIHVTLQSYWFTLMATKFVSFLFGSGNSSSSKKEKKKD